MLPDRKTVFIIKLVCVLFAAIGFLVHASTFWATYFTYPSVVEANFVNSWQLRFPAVTVCNHNAIKRTAWCTRNTRACRIIEFASQFSLTSRYPMLDFFISEDDLDNMLNQMFLQLDRQSRIELGNQFNETVLDCSFRGMSCLPYFKQFYSFRFGNCFALNVDWGTSVALYDEGLNVTTHHHQATMPLTRGLYASRWDPETTIDASLELVLNLNTAEYSWEKTRAVRLFLHPSANVAPTSQASAGGGINLEAGRFYRLATVKSITNLLPAPFATACRNYSGIWERSTRAIQTQENCLDECFWSQSLARCNCTYSPLSIMYDEGTRCESIEGGLNCLDGLKSHIMAACRASCPLPCVLEHYKYDSVDYVDWPTSLMELTRIPNLERLWPEKMNVTEARRDLVRLRLTYRTMDVLEWSHRPEYPAFKVFSMLGGFVGLWLGVSCATLAENMIGIAAFLQKFKAMFLRKKKNRKNTEEPDLNVVNLQLGNKSARIYPRLFRSNNSPTRLMTPLNTVQQPLLFSPVSPSPNLTPTTIRTFNLAPPPKTKKMSRLTCPPPAYVDMASSPSANSFLYGPAYP